MRPTIVGTILLAILTPVAGAQQPSTATPPPPAGSHGHLRELNDSFADVFEKVAPAVVVIESKRSAPTPISGLPQGFEFFLQNPNGRPVREQPNVGSGFLFRPDGAILTNAHVVEGSDEITVTLHDGRKFPAQLLGADERSDLAVLKISGSDFPVVEFGDSDKTRVGEFAFAIGTPMELPYTFTVGVVSAKGRNLQIGGGYDFIQTDASINPGNSGGPLCDIDGKIIGINALISGTNRGLGFSIPINTAKDIAAQLLRNGYVTRPWLGIGIAGIEEAAQLQNLYPRLSKGVVVTGIEPNAPAASSQLQAGDVILKVDGTEVSKASDLQHEILSKSIGQSVELTVWRSGRTLRLSVMTGEQPSPLIRASTRPTPPRDQQPPVGAARQPSSPGFSYRTADKDSLKEFGIERQASGGVIVTDVEAGSAAAVAGLEVGDIITEAGGKPVLKDSDLNPILKSMDPERGLLLLLERKNSRTLAILKP